MDRKKSRERKQAKRRLVDSQMLKKKDILLIWNTFLFISAWEWLKNDEYLITIAINTKNIFCFLPSSFTLIINLIYFSNKSHSLSLSLPLPFFNKYIQI